MSTSMTTVEALKAAKIKIKNPEHWCQYSYACDANGNRAESISPEAQSWCALGAVFSIGANPYAFPYLTKAAKEYGYAFAYTLNDYSTHAQVMKMYDRAIEFAEEDKVI